jgi:hypothetical protein
VELIAMEEDCETSSSNKAEGYLVTSLLDFYRNPRAASNFTHAAKLALNVFARNSISSAKRLEKRFIYYANALKEDLSVSSLRVFAQQCSMAANKSKEISPSNEAIAHPTMKTLKRRAKKDLAVSMQNGFSPGAAINRAAYQLLKKRRQQLAQQRFVESVRSHPLGDTLEGLMVQEKKLASEDIRNQFLLLRRGATKKNPHEGVLFGLLTKAKAFSGINLHRLLGDDLFFLCRPTGFMDQLGTIVIVEVPTSAHLGLLTYRKWEILQALKKDQAFTNAKKIHYKVATTSF